MLSSVQLPAFPAGGYGMQAAKQGNALTKQALDNQKERLENIINQPRANAAQAFTDAELQEAQAKPGLTKAQAQQASGAANLSNASALGVPSEIQLRQAQARLLDPQTQLAALKAQVIRQNFLNNGQQGGGGGTPPPQNNSQAPPQNGNANLDMNAGGGVSASPQTINSLLDQMSSQQPGQSITVPQGDNKLNNSAPVQNNNQAQKPGPYGLTAPTMNGQDFGNSLFHVDSYSPRLKNYNEQYMDQYHQYQSEIKNASDQSVSASNSNQLLDAYNNAMDKSHFKGPTLGKVDSEKSKIASGLGIAGVNMENEQAVDRLSAKNLPGVVHQLADAMHNAKFSNLDMHVAEGMNFDRSLSDANRKFFTNLTKGVNERINERRQFYTQLGNPQSGASKQNADSLWAAYQKQYPIVADDGKSINKNDVGKWPLFTTQKAIQSVSQTGDYNPENKQPLVAMSGPKGSKWEGKTYNLTPEQAKRATGWSRVG